jgi:hypothetical protein
VRDRLGIDMNGRAVIANRNGNGHPGRPAERRERRPPQRFDVGQAALHRPYDAGRALAASVEVDERWRLLALVISPTPGSSRQP